MAIVLLAPVLLHAEIAQVHVDHSVTARDLLARCDQAAHSDPARAVALLGELLDRHLDQLVEVEPGLYLPVGVAVRRPVSQWPARSLQRVQQDWELLAAEQWQGIAQSAEFGEVARFSRRWFFTSAGAQAAERAARLALEAGQFDLARLQIEDMLAYHPLRAHVVDRWRTLLAADLRLAGDDADGQQAPRAAQSQPSAATSGAQGPLPPGLPPDKREALEPLPATRPVGDLDEKANLAMLWLANLTDAMGSLLDRRQMPRHWMPVPVGLAQPGLVLTQWDSRCFAFDPATGTMVWDYSPLSERMAVRAGIAGPTSPRRPAAWQGRVYLVCDVALPQEQTRAAAAVQALACLDAQTGRPYWVRGMGERMSRDVPTILDGTPVVADGWVYVAARIARTAAYDEVFVLKVDARTGDLVARTHLFGLGRPERTPPGRVEPTRLGVRGGILYVASPAGAAGALDANSLQPIWVRSFMPQAITGAQDAEPPGVTEPNAPALWADEPLVVGDDLVVPVDASLQVLDRLSGTATHSIVLDGPVQALSARPGSPRQVAAIAGRNLYLVDAATGTVVRKIGLGTAADVTGSLCPLSSGRLLVCTQDLLRVVGPDGSAKELPVDFLPAGIPAIAQGRLYLGANGFLVCVADGAKPLAELERQMSLSDSPLPALRVGELALRMGKSDLAVEALRTAVERGAADVSRAGEPIVQRLFETCLTFARQCVQKRGTDAQRVAEQLLEIARQCPVRPQDRIEVQSIQADLGMVQDKPAEAVAAWQAILADPLLRGAPLPEELGAGVETPAGEWAQSRIAETIRRSGPQVYAAFDEEAARLLRAGQKTGDRKMLQDLLRRYPNSQHVPAALLAIGEATIRAGDTRGALEPLRRAVTLAAADPATRTQAMCQIALAYETLGNVQAAATWMARLASQSQDMTFQLAGHTWTAKQYAAHLAARLPSRKWLPCHIEPPLQPAHSQTFEDSVRLLADAAGGGADADRRVLVWAAGKLRGLDPKTGLPAWEQMYKSEAEPNVLGEDQASLIIYDRYRVTAIDPVSGQILWSWAGKGPDPHGPQVDPESVPVILAAEVTADSVLTATAGGQLTCMDRHSGRIRWRRHGEPAFVGSLAASDALVAYRGSQANSVVYRVMDVSTGQDVSLLRPVRDVPAEWVEILPSAMVLLQGTNTIEGYDAYSGALAWQVPARGRFRPTIRLRTDAALYVGDGDRQLVKIDMLTGQAAWRAVTRAETGSPVCLLGGGSAIWLIGEHGGHVIDDATGKVIRTVMLPRQVSPDLLIRCAAVCDAGVLCLAVKRSSRTPDAPRAALVLFPWDSGRSDANPVRTTDTSTPLNRGSLDTTTPRSVESLDTSPLRSMESLDISPLGSRGSATQETEPSYAGTTATVLTRIDEATGPVSGWHITDNAVWIAAGNKLITLRGRAKDFISVISGDTLLISRPPYAFGRAFRGAARGRRSSPAA